MSINISEELIRETTDWRRHIHQNPELAFEEKATSDFVIQKLKEWGLEVTTGFGKTGVVGTLTKGSNPQKKLLLRADMDALPLEEKTELSYCSQNKNTMHACGHDGHTAILLGAAKHLAEHGNFNGTIHFVFQPAEEGQAGAKKMIEDGLLKKFPVDAAFGLHNWPGYPVGTLAFRQGPLLASTDVFSIKLTGKGHHAAQPHLGSDVVVASAELIMSLQTIIARTINPLHEGVLSVTQIHAGDAHNIIPHELTLEGTVRTFNKDVAAHIKKEMENKVKGIALSHSLESHLNYTTIYPPTINSDKETSFLYEVAKKHFPENNIIWDTEPTMGAEDFSFFLEEVPGSYFFIGNGDEDDRKKLHSPFYDFNDEAIPVAIKFWAHVAHEFFT